MKNDSKPILFNTNMVRAILEGRKTQTRRIISIQDDLKKGYKCTGLCKDLFKFEHDKYLPIYLKPYYFIGDTLWVRETWQLIDKTYFYKADNDPDDEGMAWRPSIHMPREAARIFLEVISVRVERLQDMGIMDAIKEGIEYSLNNDELQQFKDLWNSLYGNWDENPWVWVIEFKLKN